jgi:hypothetical protein
MAIYQPRNPHHKLSPLRDVMMMSFITGMFCTYSTALEILPLAVSDIIAVEILALF